MTEQKNTIKCNICLDEMNINTKFKFCMICNETMICLQCYKKMINIDSYKDNCPVCKNNLLTDSFNLLTKCLSKINDEECTIKAFFYCEIIKLYKKNLNIPILNIYKAVNDICVQFIYKKNIKNNLLYEQYVDNCYNMYSILKEQNYYDETIKYNKLLIEEYDSKDAISNLLKIYINEENYIEIDLMLKDKKIISQAISDLKNFNVKFQMIVIDIICDYHKKPIEAFKILNSLYFENKNKFEICFKYAKYKFLGIGTKKNNIKALKSIQNHLHILPEDNIQTLLEIIF